MYGAVLGDIIGSRFEGESNDCKTKDFKLFGHDCRFTDDTVLTLAVCKALMLCEGDYENLEVQTMICLRKFGNAYKHRGYGRGFKRWLSKDIPEPYGSYANGAAMRVSGCGYAGHTLEEVRALSSKVTAVTHNHPEGLKGAEAVATSVFLARTGVSKADIRAYIEENYYSMDFTLDEIRRPDYFDNSCKVTVPQALMAFFESKDFEDAIRSAVYIGGDSDTIAAMAGSVAEAYYGIPEDLRKRADRYLDDNLLDVITTFEEKYPPKIV